MLQRLARTCVLCALVVLAHPLLAIAASDEWQPVSQEDLQLKRVPEAPTAAAIYLYRQVDRDDASARESVYERIKILTEEGRGLANVEIPYAKDRQSIRNLVARTIRPDGTVVEFDGQVYEKQIYRRTGYAVMSKSFTLPAVEVGSIIEYRYTRVMPFGWVYDSKWILSEKLFTRRAVFSLRPNRSFLLRWSWPLGLPPNTRPPTNEDGVIRLETQDVPAFVVEEYMPPENAMKYRVEFNYDGQQFKQTVEAEYWKAVNRALRERVMHFVNYDRPLEKEVARLVQPGDSVEAKVRKIYARAQQIRNLTFERQRTEDEIKREHLANNYNAADVLEHGYGFSNEITWLTYGLLRAANLKASVVYVPPREDSLFDARLMNGGQLVSCVVLVVLGDSAVFLDPGTPLMPFAILPWPETGVNGLLLTEDGGKWLDTSLPSANESRVARRAILKLSPDGSLEGKVTVSYSGLEAAWRRLAERHDDATERRKFLEKELESSVPVAVDVQLTNTPAWTDPETPLVAEFDFKAPGWATAAGSRSLLSLGLFGAQEKHAFEHSARVHPVYFTFPFQHTDEITIELPSGWQAGTVPEARTTDIKSARYTSSAQVAAGTLSIKRDLALHTILLPQQAYGAIHGFFQTVRAGDDDQVVVVAKH